MNLKIRMFHDANAPLADGFRRKELLSISDHDFEHKHGFIQWAFPTQQESRQVSSAPVLDLASATWLAEKPDVTEFLEAMIIRFLEFLASNNHWKCSYDHNHRRISRVIQSTRILHSWELADWFYGKVKEFAGDSFALMQVSDRYWAHYASPNHDRVAGAFVGLAIGDALGAPIEFSPRGTFGPVTTYISGGRFNLPAGAWTDDTSMALCLAQSIVENAGLVTEDVLNRFCDWAENGSNTSTGVAVGIGQNTLRVLGDFRRNGYLEALPLGSKNDGNGALMRLAPIACFAYNDVGVASLMAGEQSRATHASQTSEQSCQLLAELLCLLIRGQSISHALEVVSNRGWGRRVSSIFERKFTDQRETDLKVSGYVIETLHAALWSVMNTNNFQQAVLKAVNLGDDADTIAAVAGQIVGAMYGYSAVPKHLKAGLINERQLYVTSQFLSAD
jgi:ADP-ribosylglycohydrolase